eukprot:1192851-Prorocentrum_minimum.AAC.3
MRGESEGLYDVPCEDRQRVLQAEATLERAAKDAVKLAKEGQFRRAVQRLEMAVMADGSPETV